MMDCKEFKFVRPSFEINGETYTHKHVRIIGKYANIVDTLDEKLKSVAVVVSKEFENSSKTIQTLYQPISPEVDFIVDKYTPSFSDKENSCSIEFIPIELYKINLQQALRLLDLGFAVSHLSWYKNYIFKVGESYLDRFGNIVDIDSLDCGNNWTACDTKYYFEYSPSDILHDLHVIIARQESDLTHRKYLFNTILSLFRDKPITQYPTSDFIDSYRKISNSNFNDETLAVLYIKKNILLINSIYNIIHDNCEIPLLYSDDLKELLFDCYSTTADFHPIYPEKTYENKRNIYYNDYSCITNDKTLCSREILDKNLDELSPFIGQYGMVLYGYVCGIRHDSKKIDSDGSKTTLQEIINTIIDGIAYVDSEVNTNLNINYDFQTFKKLLLVMDTNIHHLHEIHNIVDFDSFFNLFKNSAFTLKRLTKYLEGNIIDKLKPLDDFLSDYLYKLVSDMDTLALIRLQVLAYLCGKDIDSDDYIATLVTKFIVYILDRALELEDESPLSLADYNFSLVIEDLYLSRISEADEEYIFDYGDKYITNFFKPMLLDFSRYGYFHDSYIKSSNDLQPIHYLILANSFDREYYRFVVDMMRVFLSEIFEIPIKLPTEVDDKFKLNGKALYYSLFHNTPLEPYNTEVMEDLFTITFLNDIGSILRDTPLTLINRGSNNVKDKLGSEFTLESGIIKYFENIIRDIYDNYSVSIDFEKYSNNIDNYVVNLPLNDSSCDLHTRLKSVKDNIDSFIFCVFLTIMYGKDLPEIPDDILNTIKESISNYEVVGKWYKSYVSQFMKANKQINIPYHIFAYGYVAGSTEVTTEQIIPLTDEQMKYVATIKVLAYIGIDIWDLIELPIIEFEFNDRYAFTTDTSTSYNINRSIITDSYSDNVDLSYSFTQNIESLSRYVYNSNDYIRRDSEMYLKSDFNTFELVDDNIYWIPITNDITGGDEGVTQSG